MTEPVIKEDTLVAVSPSVYARAFGEEVVLLDFARGEYFALDDVGAFIWRLLERGARIGQIADAVTSEWSVHRDDATRDVVELVEHLAQSSLVVISPGA